MVLLLSAPYLHVNRSCQIANSEIPMGCSLKRYITMAKRPVPKYDFKAFGAAIKAAREGRKESRKKVGDEMFISPRYLANIENKGQHPSLQIFFELIQRYHISVDQFLLDTPAAKDTKRRQLDALLDGMSDTGIRIVTATAKELAEVETEGR